MRNAANTRTYFSVFVVLLLLLALTIGAAYVPLGRFGWVSSLAISVTKAALIAYYFMHLRNSDRLVWVVAGAGCLWLGILVLLSMTDFMSRGWLP